MAYEVLTAAYCGTLEGLLQLIVREQVDLWEISLADLVASYLASISPDDALDLEIATEFLLILTILVELKTRRLLPTNTEVELDEEFQGDYDRDLLLARLVECHTFRAASTELLRLATEADKSHPRQIGINEDRFINMAIDLLEGVTPDNLRDAYRRAVIPKPVQRVDIAHIAAYTLTVDEALEEMTTQLLEKRKLTFRECIAGLVDRIEMVVRFLAILEMVKRGQADLEQTTEFGEIMIVWNEKAGVV